MSLFGNWISDENLENLKKQFSESLFGGHVVIEQFLKEEIVDELYKEFPMDLERYHKYRNPLEVKYAFDKIEELSENYKNLFCALGSEDFIKKIQHITGIESLEKDEFLHGAGLHVHPRYGRLHLHLDYEKHPIYVETPKQRHLNMILYMSKEWNDEWNGATELWGANEDGKPSTTMYKSNVVYNRAIIFKTTEESWHGLPEPLQCPDNIYRKSIAYYWISDLKSRKDTNKHGSNDNGYREKACFVKRPDDKSYPGDNIGKLYEIRPYRRITDDDIKAYTPNWSPEKY